MKKQYRIISKKLKWYDKLWISIKETFSENVVYSDELKNRLSFARFLWNQKVLIILLIIPIILLPVLAIYLSKQPQGNNLFEINIFSVISSVIAYAMPTLLAFIVWHSTWVQKREKENESAIRVYAEIVMNEESNNYLFPGRENTSNIKVRFTNQNKEVPIRIKYIKTFRLENTIVNPQQHRSYSYENEIELLEFNKSETFSIGFDSSLFQKTEHLYFGFYISNAYGHEVYCIVKCTVGSDGWVSTTGNEATLVDCNTYKRLKEKFGNYFIKEIVWYSPIGIRKKYKNRVYLCKKIRLKNKKKSTKKVK